MVIWQNHTLQSCLLHCRALPSKSIALLIPLATFSAFLQISLISHSARSSRMNCATAHAHLSGTQSISTPAAHASGEWQHKSHQQSIMAAESAKLFPSPKSNESDINTQPLHASWPHQSNHTRILLRDGESFPRSGDRSCGHVPRPDGSFVELQPEPLNGLVGVIEKLSGNHL